MIMSKRGAKPRRPSKTTPAKKALPLALKPKKLCVACDQPSLSWYGDTCANCYENEMQRSVRQTVYGNAVIREVREDLYRDRLRDRLRDNC